MLTITIDRELTDDEKQMLIKMIEEDTKDQDKENDLEIAFF